MYIMLNYNVKPLFQKAGLIKPYDNGELGKIIGQKGEKMEKI